MYCKKCGSEISEYDKFCPNCGADQTKDSAEGIPFEIVLKVFALICALVFLIRSLENIGYALEILEWLFWSFFEDAIAFILCLASALTGILMVIMLVLIAFRRTKENTPALTFGLVVCGVLVILARALWEMYETFSYFAYYIFYDKSGSLSTTILGVFFCVGGIYLLLYLMKQNPLPETILQNPSEKFSEIMATITSNFNKGDGQANSDYETYDNYDANDDYTAPNDYSESNYHETYGNYDQGGPRYTIKTNRSIVVYIVFNIITCGIYGWYFIYCLARDVNIMCKDDGQNTGGLLAYILLNIITCGFYSLYWMYSLGNRLASNAPRYGLSFQENGTTVLLWYLVGLLACGIGPYVAMHLLIKNTNALATAYNRSTY